MSQDKLSKNSLWMWYPDDFELYHEFLLSNRREIQGKYYPPMWEMFDVHHTVKVYKIANLEKEEKFKAISNGTLDVVINSVRYKPNIWITLKPGRNFIKLTSFTDSGFPCFYCYGETFASDNSWSCAMWGNQDTPVGTNDMYKSPNDNPCIFKFKYKNIKPVSISKVKQGYLYDFGKELMGKLIINNPNELSESIFVNYGESKEEALDTKHSTISEELELACKKTVLRTRACRYVYIKTNIDSLSISYDYEYYDEQIIGKFKCSDSLYNKIWDVSVHTLRLNTREGFFDGIKRDRWVWGGDAYQSIITNSYLTNDIDTTKRTLTMLIGRNPSQHINTIVDYSAYWILSLYEYYNQTKDLEFVKHSYPKMFWLFDLYNTTLDEYGFVVGNPKRGDWTFIDWSEIDKTGAVCAEQMLLYASYECASKLSNLVGDNKSEYFSNLAKSLKANINVKFWDEEKGAYIDSFSSGKRNVTRHANIFALTFGVANERQKKKIISNVIYNNDVTAITTPYFKFFELDAMCSLGDMKLLQDMLYSYWGEMINRGATSMFEQFDPNRKGVDIYEMYGHNFGNSLCHAWGASPIYLIGRYVLGVNKTSAGYETFEVKPNLLGLKSIDSTIPLGTRGKVSIKVDKGIISVIADCSGGTLIVNNKKHKLLKDKEISIEL